MKLLKKLLFGLLIFVALFLLAGFVLPATYRIEHSLVINAPAVKVFGIVADLKTWEDWTAWNLKMDPTMKRTFAGPTNGLVSGMSWEGSKVGQGEMKLAKIAAPKLLSYDLAFDHGKYTSVGEFQFEPAGTGTKVTWSDAGSLGDNPINRWFGLFMDKVIGPDFEKGLAGLKTLAEK